MKIVYHLEGYQIILGSTNNNDSPSIIQETPRDNSILPPSITEKEYLTVQRIGQANFKGALVERYAKFGVIHKVGYI